MQYQVNIALNLQDMDMKEISVIYTSLVGQQTSWSIKKQVLEQDHTNEAMQILIHAYLTNHQQSQYSYIVNIAVTENAFKKGKSVIKMNVQCLLKNIVQYRYVKEVSLHMLPWSVQMVVV